MSLKFGNNIYATLAAGINSSDLSITLAAGQGARFNFLVASTDYTYATLVNVTTNALEVVKLLGPPATDVLTVATAGRGADGTTAASFSAGDRIEVRIPRIVLDKLVLDENLQQTTDLRATSVGGTSSAITAVHANPLSQFGLVNGLLSIFVPTADNPGPCTYQPDGLTLKPLVKGNNIALDAGDLVLGAQAWAMYSSVIGGGSWVLLNPLSVVMTGVGSISHFPCNTAPAGYLELDGTLKVRATYPRLYAFAAASGNIAASDGAWTEGQFSPGDGSTTFRIPDLRGDFLRGWDHGRGVDSGRAIGAFQADDFKTHHHTQQMNTNVPSGGTVNMALNSNSAFPTTTALNTGDAGGSSETRPRNVAMMVCIKF